jgi:broad specificity phosphatase PhoE
MTDILFIRHGQTQANVTGHWQGWSDTPLSPAGRAQAQAIAHRLSPFTGQIAALYTSPLRRALQTAQVIGLALELKPRIVDQLKEINFGDLEGLTVTEMEHRFPELHARWQDKTDMAFRWPGGEQRAAFFKRVAQACQHILTRHPEEKVVIVAHGGTIRACLAHLLPRQMEQWWTYSLDNTGLTHTRTVADETRLLVLNDCSHLAAQEAR